ESTWAEAAGPDAAGPNAAGRGSARAGAHSAGAEARWAHPRSTRGVALTREAGAHRRPALGPVVLAGGVAAARLVLARPALGLGAGERAVMPLPVVMGDLEPHLAVIRERGQDVRDVLLIDRQEHRHGHAADLVGNGDVARLEDAGRGALLALFATTTNAAKGI